MSEIQKSIMKSRLPPRIPGNSGGPAGRGFKKDFTALPWSNYFTAQEDVAVDDLTTFRIYKTKVSQENGPVVMLIHGGGFSALTWSLFSVELTRIIHCQCIAVDLRGHGDTATADDSDLSAETLSQDLGRLYKKLFEEAETVPPVLLVGHSMGGAIAVHVAHRRLIESLIGVIVIDVVEGTAMEALSSMQSFLRSRPSHFTTVEQAIEYSVRSGQIRNVESARVSMPGQIVNISTGKNATNDDPNLKATSSSQESIPLPINTNRIAEEEEGDEGESIKLPPPVAPPSGKNYRWRIDLAQTEKYWPGWFEGLSQMFLDLPVPKQLLLASIDGLDRTLTVGQMQGKFQMQVLARCGHAVQEDRPHEVAEVIGTYMVRNKFAKESEEFVRLLPAC